MKSGISIIMPVYNSEKFLEESIESVLAQTYENFELLLIINGCTDNSLKICEKFRQKDNRIVIKIIEEKGVSFARNTGIEISIYDKIMFVDSDDIYNNSIAQKMSALDEKELNVCTFEKFNDINKIKKKKNKRIEENNENDKIIGMLHKNDLFNAVWNKIYWKKILIDYNIRFDINLNVAEDLKFNLEYLKYIDKINILYENLYYYRINNNGLNVKFDKNRINIRKKLYELEKNIFVEKKYKFKYLYMVYIKICLAELKQINKMCKANKEKRKKIKEILNDSNRKKELNEIYINCNLVYKIFVLCLNNQFILELFAKIIDILKK